MPHILIVQFASDRSGSALSGLLVAKAAMDLGLQVTVAFAHDGPIIDEYKSLGCKTVIVPHKNWLRRGSSLSFIKDFVTEYRSSYEFSKLIRKVNPVVVYVNTAASLAGVIAANKEKVPVVWHMRELFQDVGGEMKCPKWAHGFVRSSIASRATRLVANSQFVAKNMLVESASKKATVISNAVSDEFSDIEFTSTTARALLGLPEDKRIIGIPGTLRPVKGHQFFFEATHGWLTDNPEVNVAVTGSIDQPHARKVIDLVKAIGIERQVIFLGSISNMPAFYRACDLVVVPSRAEPFGRVVIEAFAAGTPVIATGVGGIQEIMRHEENGLYCEYGDENGLVTAVSRSLSNPNETGALVQNARRDFDKHYSEAIHKRKIADVVSGLIGKAG